MVEALARAVPTYVAAQLIGKSEDFIRWGLQQGRLPIGNAVRSSYGSRWSYYISPKLLSNYTGVTVLTIERMSEEYRSRRKKGL